MEWRQIYNMDWFKSDAGQVIYRSQPPSLYRGWKHWECLRHRDRSITYHTTADEAKAYAEANE